MQKARQPERDHNWPPTPDFRLPPTSWLSCKLKSEVTASKSAATSRQR
ncbi:MAG: hypothetical protein RM368_32985 [Nostoc sp. DedSLP03]|nr:hypothetical protein [Nostoc sp. DedSLP03]